MTEKFDAAAKALEIEHLAKTNLDSQNDVNHSIESSVVDAESDRNLRLEFAQLQKNPEQLLAVGKELEKLSNENFSTLPNVYIKAHDGQMISLSFTPSAFDLKANRLPTSEVIALSQRQEH